MRQLDYTLVPERPLDTPVHRKGWRPVKPRPRPYPKPAASVGAARRHSREDARPMIPAPADNYVGFPPVIAGYVPEYGDGMEIDATGPFFTPVVSNATSHPHGIATASDINVPFNGGLPGIQIMVGYVPEFSETVEVDQEGSSIPSENPGMTEAPYHTDFNGPPYAGPQVNVLAAHLGVGNPYNSIINNPVQVAFLHANPPYNPREPLFPTRPRNVDVPAPAYPVQPPAPKALNAPSVVTVEEHPGNREELFNELFGDDGEEEEQEVGVAPDPPWGGDLVGEHDGDGDEDEEEVEIII